MMMRSLAISICAAGLALGQTATTPTPAGPGPRGRGPNPTFGRGPGRGPGRGLDVFGPNAETRLTKQLGLNATQQNTLHTALASAKVQQQGMNEKMMASQKELGAAVKAGDEGAIERITRDMSTLHQQRTAIQAKTLASFYGTLSADQKAKVEPMINRELGLGGPGRGPGRPGPGGRGPRPQKGAVTPQ